MRALVGLLAGVVLTGLLLWLVLGGANAWRRAVAAPPAPGRDHGAVRVEFRRAPRDAGAADAGRRQ